MKREIAIFCGTMETKSRKRDCGGLAMKGKRSKLMNMIKWTIYKRTIRSKKVMTSSIGMDLVMDCIGKDVKRQDLVEAVRAESPALAPTKRQECIARLPLICPGMEMRKRRDGSTASIYNGIVLLEVDLSTGNNNYVGDADNLKATVSNRELTEIKEKVASWPTTLAAITGCSGNSLKILVRGTLPDGSLPTENATIERFHALLYKRSAAVYSTVIGHPLKNKEAKADDTFRWTWDPQAVFNSNAAPIHIQNGDLHRRAGTNGNDSREYSQDSVEPGTKNQRFYAMRFALAVNKVQEGIFKEQGGCAKKTDIHDEEEVAMIARQCVRLGIPLEETTHQFKLYQSPKSLGTEQIRTIVDSVYLAERHHFDKDRSHTIQVLTMSLHSYMNTRYDLRYNELTNSVEWRLNNSASFVFQSLDTRMLNTMIQEARENGIEVSDRDMKRFLGSTRVRSYNAARAFISKSQHSWDGHTDHIGALADRVPARNPHWREWFHTWFLGMVAQWEGLNYNHDNSVVPLLIGQQGCGKSSFGQLILPPELRSVGYRELADISNKQEVERLLTTSLLINFDELNHICNHLQQGFLKNLLQKSSVKVRHPYSSAITEQERYASFIATTNITDVLGDSSGSRHFIAAEIRDGATIDTSDGIFYPALYDQAIEELFTQHRRPYFTPNEIQQIEAYNMKYANMRPEVEQLLNVYEPVSDKQTDAEWLSTTELANEVHQQTHFKYSNRSLNYLGRWLTSEARALRIGKRISHGIAIYSVRRLK